MATKKKASKSKKKSSAKKKSPKRRVLKLPKAADVAKVPVATTMHHGSLTSERHVTHLGHSIKITTTYEIEIDGRPISLHARVDETGQLACHATPYERYPSANAMVKRLIELYPEQLAKFLAAPPSGDDDGHHGGHGHGHGGHA